MITRRRNSSGITSVARRRHYRRAILAARLAVVMLTAKGYRILDRRYRTPVGEVDLVILRGRRLAFVEVKRRATIAEALHSVTAKQRKRIMRAAQLWLKQHPQHGGADPCFDVIVWAHRAWPRHLQNAFGP